MTVEVGSVLQILGGTFKGMEARVVAIRGDDFEVSVSVFGRETSVTLQAEDLGVTPLARKADRVLERDAEIEHQFRMGEYWTQADTATEAAKVEAWVRFLVVRQESQEQRDSEASQRKAELLQDFADNGDAIRAVQSNPAKWRPKLVRLKERIAAGETLNYIAVQEEAERAHWRAHVLAAAAPSGWAEDAAKTFVIRQGEDFSQEVRRTIQAVHEAIRTYGLAGLRAAWPRLYGEGELITLEELPDEHPWRDLAGLAPRIAIERLFPKGHCIADILSDRVRAIFAVSKKETFQLLYLLDAFERFYENGAEKVFEVPSYVVGNPPTRSATLNAYARELGWTLPEPLAELYSVHNGLGPNMLFDAASITPLERLEVHGRMMNPIVEEQDDVPQDFDYDDLLGFFHDGMGNGQFFHRAADGLTRDWDHETRQLGQTETFESFCRERLPSVWLGQR